MLVPKQLQVAIDFHNMEENTLEVNGYTVNGLGTNTLQNIFFWKQSSC